MPKQLFRTFRYFYIYLELEFKSSLTLGGILLMNKIHAKSFNDGDIVTGLVIVLYAMNFRQGWVYLEDCWY